MIDKTNIYWISLDYFLTLSLNSNYLFILSPLHASEGCSSARGLCELFISLSVMITLQEKKYLIQCQFSVCYPEVTYELVIHGWTIVCRDKCSFPYISFIFIIAQSVWGLWARVKRVRVVVKGQQCMDGGVHEWAKAGGVDVRCINVWRRGSSVTVSHAADQ